MRRFRGSRQVSCFLIAPWFGALQTALQTVLGTKLPVLRARHRALRNTATCARRDRRGRCTLLSLRDENKKPTDLLRVRPKVTLTDCRYDVVATDSCQCQFGACEVLSTRPSNGKAAASTGDCGPAAAGSCRLVAIRSLRGVDAASIAAASSGGGSLRSGQLFGRV